MIRGLYTSSAGMQVEVMRQDAIANNLANLNTSGFRRDLTIMEARAGMKLSRTNQHTSADPLGPTKRVPIGDLGAGVFVNRVVKDFKQGDMHDTQNPFDMALQGEGFFTVQDNKGEKFYTRDGAFTRAKDGTVQDKSGRVLLGEKGPIRAVGGDFQVGIDGSVALSGRPLDRLAVVRFADPEADLEKVGDTMFRFRGAGAGRQPLQSNAEVNQGMLESANVNSVHEMVEMIAALRQYEANQKALQQQDETLGRAVNDIAKG